MGIQVFYSYSHKDERFKEVLETHLSVLKREGYIDAWSDRKITAGSEWKEDINMNLEKAKLVLLLVSENFLASDYCYETETIFALEQQEKKKCIVVPVILKPCLFSRSRLKHLQALPKDSKPVTQWRDRGAAWLNVAEGIIKTIEDNPAIMRAGNYENIIFGKAPVPAMVKTDGSLDEVIIAFLSRYNRWYFSPLRIQRWGGRQSGFELLEIMTPVKLRPVLTRLQSKGRLVTTRSKNGNILYRYAG